MPVFEALMLISLWFREVLEMEFDFAKSYSFQRPKESRAELRGWDSCVWLLLQARALRHQFASMAH